MNDMWKGRAAAFNAVIEIIVDSGLNHLDFEIEHAHDWFLMDFDGPIEDEWSWGFDAGMTEAYQAIRVFQQVGEGQLIFSWLIARIDDLSS